MEGDGIIRTADFIQDDGTIQRIIRELDNLLIKMRGVDEELKETAREAIKNLKDVSSATMSGKAQTEQLILATDGLSRAFVNMRIAQSEIGRETAWYKSQVAATNKETVRYRKELQMAEGSYDKINAELQEYIKLWESLTPAERVAADYGQEVAKTIQNLRQNLHDIRTELEPVKVELSEVEKAERKLAYLQSEEGQRLLELKRQITEITTGRKAEKEEVDRLTKATEALSYVFSDEYARIQQLNAERNKQKRIVQLQNQLNNSAEGSYNKLKAQYELNQIALREMSAEERNNIEVGGKLEAQTRAIYKEMAKMQERTGSYAQAVGKFKLEWNGLSNATTQIVRELPAAAVSLNTFFLGISNNVPILVDEIERVRQKNKMLIAEGKPAESVIKTITSAVFNWQTALVILLTLLASNGKQIIEWTKSIIKGNRYVKNRVELLEEVNEALEKNGGEYGKNRVSLRKLSDEWKTLTSDEEKLQFIKDNKTAFDQLDVSVRNVADAENILVKNTEAFIEAMKLRARAAAAQKVATDKYEKAFLEREKARQKELEGPSFGSKLIGALATGSMASGVGTYSGAPTYGQGVQAAHAADIKKHEDRATALETEADALMGLAEANEAAARAELKRAGIEEAHKPIRTPKGRQPRDLTDTIWKNDLSIRKKYEMSITALQRDEFAKRRLQAIDQTNATIREMQEKFRKNQDFLENKDGKYRPLTPEQKRQIEEQQAEINAIIANENKKLEIDLQNIEYERQVDNLKKLREVLDWRIDIIANSIEEEKNLRLKQLEDEQTLYGTTAVTSEGGEVVVTGTMTPEQRAAFERKKQQIIAEYTKLEVNLYKQRIEDELEITKKGTDEELRLLLERNEAERKLALAENALKPVSERRSEDDINAVYNQRDKLIGGKNELTNFDQMQAAEEAVFNIKRRSEYQITKFTLKQERDRWKKQIALAESGAIKWSDAQLKEAEATLEGLERQISETNFLSQIGEKGLGGALLDQLGFDEKSIAALSDAANTVIDNIKSIIDAEVEAAEKAVDLAEKRVSAAQSAYDAEVEARNNGYANNVATAKKELQNEKKKMAEKQKILADAQKKQEAIDTAMQVSSLITATANLWASMSKLGPFSVAAAIAATAAMWGSFAYAKIKAREVTSSSDTYGEGGLEFLEGGSHASGNDIDLHTTNSRGKNMRAEGGEAMAIINKRNTRKYRRVLPNIVESLNSGTFEDRYAQAFQAGDALAAQISFNKDKVDLSKLEQDVHALKKSSEQKQYSVGNTLFITKGNVTKIIKS